MAIIEYRVEDGVAILTWDDKDRPMNVLSGDALAELSAGVDKAVADDGVKGIILTSGKQGVFVAGGDLQQIESLGSGPIDAGDLLKRTGAVLEQLQADGDVRQAGCRGAQRCDARGRLRDRARVPPASSRQPTSCPGGSAGGGTRLDAGRRRHPAACRG